MSESVVLQLLDDGESLLCDLFLSGFNSVSMSTIEKCKALQKSYSDYGMKTGALCMKNLERELLQRKNSFSYDIAKLTKEYCYMDFYIKTAKEQLK